MKNQEEDKSANNTIEILTDFLYSFTQVDTKQAIKTIINEINWSLNLSEFFSSEIKANDYRYQNQRHILMTLLLYMTMYYSNKPELKISETNECFHKINSINTKLLSDVMNGIFSLVFPEDIWEDEQTIFSEYKVNDGFEIFQGNFLNLWYDDEFAVCKNFGWYKKMFENLTSSQLIRENYPFNQYENKVPISKQLEQLKRISEDFCTSLKQGYIAKPNSEISANAVFGSQKTLEDMISFFKVYFCDVLPQRKEEISNILTGFQKFFYAISGRPYVKIQYSGLKKKYDDIISFEK